jgi:hypothetical protein
MPRREKMNALATLIHRVALFFSRLTMQERPCKKIKNLFIPLLKICG